MLRTALALVVVLATTDAGAEGDNRPQDRFYFGLHAGIASYADSISDTSNLGSPASAFALETALWPNDYLGFGWGYDVATLTTTSTGLGAYAVAALPLRYVQPYAGVWFGARYLQIDDQGELELLYHPVVGLNGYVNRNTRLFAQVQGVRLDGDTELRAQLITAGLRWSPDAFHRLRGADKFNALWLSTLASVGAFVVTRRVLGGEWL